MKIFVGLVNAATVLLTILNVIILIGTTIDLIEEYVGCLAYILWIIVTPILSPTLLGLPWFEAWVAGSDVSQAIFWIWLLWIVCIAIRIPLVAAGLDSND